jgi:hypothetical protein
VKKRRRVVDGICDRGIRQTRGLRLLISQLLLPLDSVGANGAHSEQCKDQGVSRNQEAENPAPSPAQPGAHKSGGHGQTPTAVRKAPAAYDPIAPEACGVRKLVIRRPQQGDSACQRVRIRALT